MNSRAAQHNRIDLHAHGVASWPLCVLLPPKVDGLRLALQHLLVLHFQLALALFLTTDNLLLLTDRFRRGSGMGRQEREQETACRAEQHIWAWCQTCAKRYSGRLFAIKC